MATRILRKLRYLLQRALRLVLLTAWAVVLSPLTIGSRTALALGQVALAQRWAEAAERRNPFTPGLTRLLVRVHTRAGNTAAAARAAAAWARSHNRWDSLTYSAWSDHFLYVPGWQPRVDLPRPSGELSGELSLLTLPALPLGRTAGSGYDALATELAAGLASPPARVITRADDRAGLAVAAAISDWCGAAVELVER